MTALSPAARQVLTAVAALQSRHPGGMLTLVPERGSVVAIDAPEDEVAVADAALIELRSAHLVSVEAHSVQPGTRRILGITKEGLAALDGERPA
jgi:hypothetical protein